MEISSHLRFWASLMVSQPGDSGLRAICCCTVSSAQTGFDTTGLAGVATAEGLIAALGLATGLAGCAKLETERASNRPPAAKISCLMAARRRPPGWRFARQGWAAGDTLSASRAVTGVWLSEGMGCSVIKISE